MVDRQAHQAREDPKPDSGLNLASLFDVAGKSALVTGGTRGIGAMIAEGLLSAGARVHICARKAAELEPAVERLSAIGTCFGVQADLGTAEGCRTVAEAVSGREEALHILVNNAGAAWTKPLDDYGRENFERLMAVNLTGPFDLITQLLPLLRKAARPDDPARVVNISSVGGFVPPSGDGYAYSASKAGLIMLTRHLATRLAREHITVNAIAPGVFPSRMTRPYFKEDGSHGWAIPLERIGTMEDIAGTVIYLSSRAGAYLTGTVIPVSGGLGTAEGTAKGGD